MCRSSSTPAAPATAATTTRAHAGSTPTATCSCAAPVVSLGTSGSPAEGVAVSSTAARKIPASYAISSPAAGPIAGTDAAAGAITNTAAAGAITNTAATSPIARAAGPIARQGAALAAELLPGTSLAVRKRVAPRGAPKSVRGSSVFIRGPPAMLRIVFPVGISTTISAPNVVTVTTPAIWLLGRPVAAAYVRVPVEIVVVVDGDVVVAAPAAAPTPTATPERTHHHADAE